MRQLDRHEADEVLEALNYDGEQAHRVKEEFLDIEAPFTFPDADGAPYTIITRADGWLAYPRYLSVQEIAQEAAKILDHYVDTQYLQHWYEHVDKGVAYGLVSDNSPDEESTWYTIDVEVQTSPGKRPWLLNAIVRYDEELCEPDYDKLYDVVLYELGQGGQKHWLGMKGVRK